MTTIATKIDQEIRQLSLADMLGLHERLVVSIHEKEDEQPLDPVFRKEIKRRVWEIDSGEVEGADAFEALRKM